MTYNITPVDGAYSAPYVQGSGFPTSFRYFVASAWIELKNDHSGWQLSAIGYNVNQDANRGVYMTLDWPLSTPPRFINIQVGDGNSHSSNQMFGYVIFNTNALVANQYYHFLISIDSVANVVQCYVNDVALTQSGATWYATNSIAEPTSGGSGTANGSINTLAANNFVGTNPCMADVFMGVPPSFFDLTISSNRRKFINADLSPVYLGANGELPFGTPQVYATVPPLGNASDFLTNRGSAGGTFVNTGAGSLCPLPSSQHLVTVADLWFGETTGFVDLSIESNRRKFITLSGCTENLGNDGSTPFGSAPPVYLTGSVFTNAGNGGTFDLINGLISNPDPAPCCSDTAPPLVLSCLNHAQMIKTFDGATGYAAGKTQGNSSNLSGSFQWALFSCWVETTDGRAFSFQSKVYDPMVGTETPDGASVNCSLLIQMEPDGLYCYVFDATMQFVGYGQFPTLTPGCHHIIMSIDSVNNIMQCYIDDIEQSPASVFWSNTNLIGVPASPGSQDYFAPDNQGRSMFGNSCCAGDFWLAQMPNFFDLTVEANRRLFLASDLTPVDLGTNGIIDVPMPTYVSGIGVNAGISDVMPAAFTFVLVSLWVELGASGGFNVSPVEAYVPAFYVGGFCITSLGVAGPGNTMQVNAGNGVDSIAFLQQFVVQNYDISDLLPNQTYNIIVSIDSISQVIQVCIDGVIRASDGTYGWATSSQITKPPTDYTVDNFSIGTNQFGLSSNGGCMADVYVALPDTFFDLSNPTNVQKFRNTDGTPVDLGTTASSVLGVEPLVWLTRLDGEPASAFFTNRTTTGGSFDGFWTDCPGSEVTPNIFLTIRPSGVATDFWINNGGGPASFDNYGTQQLLCDETPPPDVTRFRNVSGTNPGTGRGISDAGDAIAIEGPYPLASYWSEATGYEQLPNTYPDGVTYVAAISSDGLTVVGNYQNGDGTIMLPYYWTHSGGMTTIPIPSPFTRGFVTGCNTDASVISGYLVDDNNLNGNGQQYTVPFIWNGTLTQLPQYESFWVTGIGSLLSRDGTTLVGLATNVGDTSQGPAIWTWRQGTGYETISDDIVYEHTIVINAITPDGNTVVGYNGLDSNAFLWRRGIGITSPIISHVPDGQSQFFDISDDGTKAVGYRIGAGVSFQEGILYEINTDTLTDLGVFGTLGTDYSQATTISGDGTTIGMMGNVPEFGNINQPILWTLGTGLIDINTPQIVMSQTIRNPDNWIYGYPQFFVGMNQDGTRFQGQCNISGQGLTPTVWYNNQTFTMWG